MNDGKLDVSDCCVGVGLPLLTIYRAFQHDRFAAPCALINLILYCRTSVRRGTVESVVESCIRNHFDAHIIGCVRQMIAHGLVQRYPAENSTAIVRGKWPRTDPDMQSMVYSEFLSS